MIGQHICLALVSLFRVLILLLPRFINVPVEAFIAVAGLTYFLEVRPPMGKHTDISLTHTIHPLFSNSTFYTPTWSRRGPKFPSFP
jgi:hypothetical protein